MKNVFSTFFLVLFAITVYSQQLSFVMDSVMNEYMKNGLATKQFRPDGKEDKNKLRQGFWKDYMVKADVTFLSTNGTIENVIGNFLLYGEGKFVDGKREGKWKNYVIEDKTFKKILQQELSYKRGSKEGSFKYFYPSGRLCSTGEYINDNTEGTVKGFYEDGALHGIAFFKEGNREGKHTYYHQNGKVSKILNYVRDTVDGRFESYYPSGSPKEISYSKMGVDHGVYQYYYENGQLWTERTYKDGLLVHVKGSFDDKGNPRDKGTFDKSNGTGTVLFYTQAGELYLIKTYENGVEIKEEEIITKSSTKF